MADYSDHRQLAIGIVVLNMAARGWAAAGLGAMLGFFLADLSALFTDDDLLITNIGLIAACALYMLLPGALLAGGLALVRHFFFPRVVWGNAHWIFPLMAAAVAMVLTIGIGLSGA